MVFLPKIEGKVSDFPSHSRQDVHMKLQRLVESTWIVKGAVRGRTSANCR